MKKEIRDEIVEGLLLAIFSMLSIPFFTLGFLFSFAQQGFKDGVKVERILRDLIDK